MSDDVAPGRSLLFPVISHGAELLVQGYLMRRNILAYKAPPHNEGYSSVSIPIRTRSRSRFASRWRAATPLTAIKPSRWNSPG